MYCLKKVYFSQKLSVFVSILQCFGALIILYVSFFHLTALDVTFMWLVLNSGRHLCFETCSINGTTLNYSVNTACFSFFLFLRSLCAYFFPVHPFFFFEFLSAINSHIPTTSKKCLTTILVSILQLNISRSGSIGFYTCRYFLSWFENTKYMM